VKFIQIKNNKLEAAFTYIKIKKDLTFSHNRFKFVIENEREWREKMEQTEKPQGIYFDSEGRIWFANKHWTVDEFVNRCEGIEK